MKTPLAQKEDALRAGSNLDHFKEIEHLVIDIADRGFAFSSSHEIVQAEATLDGIYLTRTCQPVGDPSAETPCATASQRPLLTGVREKNPSDRREVLSSQT
jgi:hypothetical protein